MTGGKIGFGMVASKSLWKMEKKEGGRMLVGV